MRPSQTNADWVCVRKAFYRRVGEAVRSTCVNSHEEEQENDCFCLSLLQTILWPYISCTRAQGHLGNWCTFRENDHIIVIYTVGCWYKCWKIDHIIVIYSLHQGNWNDCWEFDPNSYLLVALGYLGSLCSFWGNDQIIAIYGLQQEFQTTDLNVGKLTI